MKHTGNKNISVIKHSNILARRGAGGALPAQGFVWRVDVSPPARCAFFHTQKDVVVSYCITGRLSYIVKHTVKTLREVPVQGKCSENALYQSFLDSESRYLTGTDSTTEYGNYHGSGTGIHTALLGVCGVTDVLGKSCSHARFLLSKSREIDSRNQNNW